ncbi:proton-conducting transporter transmembrane domain-containing protein, partial [Staphylococcus epidermidis]|uniref:proton-conducting transporter transmembrane domain-containing protein n=1 Tax=Staphylococcus epidermidis TaxID=1282 RepID=UPI0021B3748A
MPTISLFFPSPITLLHLHYNTQLLPSTITQIPFILLQSPLRPYSAPILHLIFHPLFKPTLFLQSASVLKTFNIPTPPSLK